MKLGFITSRQAARHLIYCDNVTAETSFLVRMCEAEMGRSCRSESSGVDRAGGLRCGFPRGDLYCVAEIWVRHVIILKSIVSTYKTSREARDAVAAGASEIDMVLNYELLKQGDFSSIYTELATVRQAVRQTAPGQITLKVILETSQLSHSEIIAGCIIAEAAKIDFVKTSTGFKGGGATEEHVNLMRKAVGDRLKVKASGGIKTVKDCITMMEAGANRIGTSNGVWIMEEAKALMDQLTHDAGGNGLDRRPSVPTTRLFYS